MRRIRISLRSLILLVTVVGLYLGFNAWRRQRILDKAEYFARYDIELIVPSSWHDYFWQRHPRYALINVPSELYSPDNETLNNELAQFGVTEWTYAIRELEPHWEDTIDDTRIPMQTEIE